MQMIERADETDMFRQQHAVPKDVTRHVTAADNSEFLALRVTAHFAKMPFYRFPAAARGDTHFLVIVSSRAARSESVPKPVPLGQRDLVGDIGKRGGSLVRGNDQVRIVLIHSDDAVRRCNAAIH